MGWVERADLQVAAEGGSGGGGTAVPNGLAVSPNSPIIEAGRYYTSHRTGGSSGSNRTFAADSINFAAFYAPMDIVIDRIAMRETVAPGTYGKFGVYEAAANGKPGTLVYTSPTAAATTGGTEATVSYTLEAGKAYWLAYHAPVSTPNVAVLATGSGAAFGASTVTDTYQSSAFTATAPYAGGMLNNPTITYLTPGAVGDGAPDFRVRVASFDTNTMIYSGASPVGPVGPQGEPGQGLPAQIDVFNYTTPAAQQTWTKPADAKAVTIIAIAAGSGGGSGKRDAANTARSGGGGGGGGSTFSQTYVAAEIPATLLAQVGQGGAGGAAVTVDTTNGNSGTAGTASSVFVTGANGGGYFAYTTVGGAGGGGAGSGTGGAGASPANLAGGAGGAGSSTAGGATGPSSFLAISAGGGGGGGVTVGNVVNWGGGGGYSFQTQPSSNPAAAGGNTTSAVNGENGKVPRGTYVGGTGGGGGGSQIGVPGGSGGNGGGYGGGGGGGGASANGQPSGKGGDGSHGVIVFITYF